MYKIFFLFLFLFSCSGSNISKWNKEIMKTGSISQKERFLHYSEVFLGKKYESNPIKNKIYNLEKVDCITYIHNIFALSKSNRYSEFIKNITETTLYDYRNIKNDNDLVLQKRHFTMLDYILGSGNSDHFKVVTDQIIPENHIINRAIEIDKKSFFEKVYNLKTDHRKEKLPIKYADAKRLKNYYDDIVKYLNHEKVLILLLIPNKETAVKIKKFIGSDIDIHHLGIIFLNNKKRIILRHASFGNSVLDVDLEEYVDRQILNKLGGFSFIKIVEKN